MDEATSSMEMMEVGMSSGVMEQPRSTGDTQDLEKASGQQGGGLRELARMGIEKLREKLNGRALWRSKGDGKLRIRESSMAKSTEESEIRLEELIEEGEDVVVEIEKGEEVQEGKEGSVSSVTTAGYGFLEEIGEEEKDEELEQKNSDNRKRKGREENATMKVKGLKNAPGWRERAETSREDERWKRVVEKEEDGVKEEKVEKIPLPDSYDLGLDIRGKEINSSVRKNHNFGANKKAVFPKSNGGRGEGKNWLASFTRGGCVGCRDSKGVNCHDGRSGEPVILVVGDEATPSAVGHSKKGEQNSCCWVFKKEHLGLNEVPGILQRLDEEKKAWDKDSGRRSHEFFLPNGSKILVGSYTNLRRDGLEGYISQFNNMVKDCWTMMGDIGVEVLPFVPVIYEGIDSIGGELLGGVKNWIEWISVQKGKESVGELAKTGGVEVCWGRSTRTIYRPSFISMTNRGWKDGDREWRNKGNRVDFVRGEKKEVEIRHLKESEEIGKMMRSKGKEQEEESVESERRKSFERGPSVEAEYAFAKAVSSYSRLAVKDGSYKGRPIGNVREQLAARAGLEEKVVGKSYVTVVGGSQIVRIAEKMEQVGGEAVGIWRRHKISGELTREKIEKVRMELLDSEVAPDCIVVGGPSNSLIRHGPNNRRGFGPEKRLVLKEDGKGGELRQEFHLTEPARLSMVERVGVVRMVEELVKVCRETVPEARIVYLGMCPRHVERCCDRQDHMTEDDSWILENQRREVELEVKLRLEKEVEVVQWFEAKGLDKEPELAAVRRMGVVGEDGVHMSEDMCRSTAVALCFRLAEADVRMEGVRENKRQRRW